jgi:hypothetical protein
MNYEKNWIFHSGISSPAEGTTFIVNRNDTVCVEISGTATSSTVQFKGLAPSGAYYSIMGVNLSDLSVATSTTGKGQLWQFDTTGIVGIQMNISAIDGGNLTVVGKVVNTVGA